MNTLNIEKFAPIFLSAISIIAWWKFGFHFSISYVKELLAGIMTASAIGAGFMATALSILLTISNSNSAKKIKESKYSTIFYRYIRSCFYSCLILAGTTLTALTQINIETGLSLAFTSIIIGVSTYTIAAFIRITEILLDIFEAN